MERTFFGTDPTTIAAAARGFEVTASEFHFNPIGTLHGGLVATLCDSAIGFLKAITRGRFRCEGKVVHRGGREGVRARLLGLRAGHVAVLLHRAKDTLRRCVSA